MKFGVRKLKVTNLYPQYCSWRSAKSGLKYKIFNQINKLFFINKIHRNVLKFYEENPQKNIITGQSILLRKSAVH